jgi:predicted RNA-binding protein YlxR (DUF448 family)
MTKAKTSSPPARHIPQRTCIACRRTGAKRELVRLVCLSDGRIQVDATGKKSGRGAYLCLSTSCWESALNTGRLEHAFRTGIKPEDKQQLENYARGINNKVVEGKE